MGMPIDNQPGAGTDGPTDAELVAATLGGDRLAMAAIYDRYADRLHTMCVHMLGDRDEAADVCGEVFLVAFQRLDQLRDPSRLRPWLFAVCRNEVFGRTRRRGRIRLVGQAADMDRLIDQGGDTSADDVGDAAALALVVSEAAQGLDDRDRLVLELQLQGLDGEDLASALGTSISTSYQHVHRMRERMERSVGALLVARQGRSECDDLDRLLTGWDGHFSVLWRKRVARHVDACEVCGRRRSAVPAALFGTAGASPLVVTPTSVRERVLSGAVVGGPSAGTGGGRRWRGDGFPPVPGDSRRSVPLALAAVVALLLLTVGVIWVVTRDDAASVATAVTGRPAPEATSTTGPATTTTGTALTTGVTSTMPLTVAPTVAPSTAPTRSTTTTMPSPTTTARTATSTSTSTSTTSSTTTTTAVPPTLRLSGPATLYARAADGGSCANQQFAANITSASVPSAVTLRWTVGSTTGSLPMARNRTRNGWNATIDLPFGTAGNVVVVAEAVSGGSTGRSNTLTVAVAPCPVIG